LPLDEFKLQVLQRLVIKVELTLEQAVRYAPTPLQHRQSLIDYLFKRHGVVSYFLSYPGSHTCAYHTTGYREGVWMWPGTPAMPFVRYLQQRK
jgi:hypothetical protein